MGHDQAIMEGRYHNVEGELETAGESLARDTSAIH